ncbi:uncharacterized protein LOC144138332 isoform X2 [Haemaphysalis longicornis]
MRMEGAARVDEKIRHKPHFLGGLRGGLGKAKRRLKPLAVLLSPYRRQKRNVEDFTTEASLINSSLEDLKPEHNSKLIGDTVQDDDGEITIATTTQNPETLHKTKIGIAELPPEHLSTISVTTPTGRTLPEAFGFSSTTVLGHFATSKSSDTDAFDPQGSQTTTAMQAPTTSGANSHERKTTTDFTTAQTHADPETATSLYDGTIETTGPFHAPVSASGSTDSPAVHQTMREHGGEGTKVWTTSMKDSFTQTPTVFVGVTEQDFVTTEYDNAFRTTAENVATDNTYEPGYTSVYSGGTFTTQRDLHTTSQNTDVIASSASRATTETTSVTQLPKHISSSTAAAGAYDEFDTTLQSATATRMTDTSTPLASAVTRTKSYSGASEIGQTTEVTSIGSEVRKATASFVTEFEVYETPEPTAALDEVSTPREEPVGHSALTSNNVTEKTTEMSFGSHSTNPAAVTSQKEFVTTPRDHTSGDQFNTEMGTAGEALSSPTPEFLSPPSILGANVSEDGIMTLLPRSPRATSLSTTEPPLTSISPPIAVATSDMYTESRFYTDKNVHLTSTEDTNIPTTELSESRVPEGTEEGFRAMTTRSPFTLVYSSVTETIVSDTEESRDPSTLNPGQEVTGWSSPDTQSAYASPLPTTSLRPKPDLEFTRGVVSQTSKGLTPTYEEIDITRMSIDSAPSSTESYQLPTSFDYSKPTEESIPNTEVQILSTHKPALQPTTLVGDRRQAEKTTLGVFTTSGYDFSLTTTLEPEAHQTSESKQTQVASEQPVTASSGFPASSPAFSDASQGMTDVTTVTKSIKVSSVSTPVPGPVSPAIPNPDKVTERPDKRKTKEASTVLPEAYPSVNSVLVRIGLDADYDACVRGRKWQFRDHMRRQLSVLLRVPLPGIRNVRVEPARADLQQRIDQGTVLVTDLEGNRLPVFTSTVHSLQPPHGTSYSPALLAALTAMFVAAASVIVAAFCFAKKHLNEAHVSPSSKRDLRAEEDEEEEDEPERRFLRLASPNVLMSTRLDGPASGSILRDAMILPRKSLVPDPPVYEHPSMDDGSDALPLSSLSVHVENEVRERSTATWQSHPWAPSSVTPSDGFSLEPWSATPSQSASEASFRPVGSGVTSVSLVTQDGMWTADSGDFGQAATRVPAHKHSGENGHLQ